MASLFPFVLNECTDLHDSKTLFYMRASFYSNDKQQSENQRLVLAGEREKSSDLQDLSSGLWTSEFQILNSGPWTLDPGPWTQLDSAGL